MAPTPLWTPRPDWRTRTRIGAFTQLAEAAAGRPIGDYDALWRWSTQETSAFWELAWDDAGLGDRDGTPAVTDLTMPGTHWFAGTRVNYAERWLRGPLGPGAPGVADPDALALVARSQTRADVSLTRGELAEQVARCAAGLTRLGVGKGDRVAAYLPNVPETLVAFLATASLGAIWASVAPEFGVRGCVDRLGQLAPKVLLAIDGYGYGAKRIDRRADVRAIAAQLEGLEHTVLIGYLDPAATPEAIGATTDWAGLLADGAPLAFHPVAFDHPLYVLFSSGTTGKPKPIVHGHGGILLEHAKALALHHELGPGDRFFWFSTTGWMMWNLLVSGGLVGATLVLFDGDPAADGPGTLWALAAELRVTYFGVGAPLLTAGMRAGLTPGRDHDLSALTGVGSTGAPLPAEAFHWVYEAVGDHLLLGSLSGGTDVCTGVVGSAANVPLVAGESACRMLGCAVEAWDAGGHPVVGELGELVLARPLPSMPVGFWGDESGSRYRAAYFEEFPGVWRHGDWIRLTDRGSAIITGRSDATLNRGGVRLGTAELYGAVEGLPEVADSLAVHLPDGTDLGELVLFVVPADGVTLDAELVRRIRTLLRTELSPRHVPDRVEALAAVPRTVNGKKCEVPAKKVLMGGAAAEVASPSSLLDPDALTALEAHRRGA